MTAPVAGNYDRTRILSRAASACRKGRRRRAIALYQRVLAIEPNNVELHQKLAPLLAELGRSQEAVASYLEIVRADRELGRPTKALATLRSAVAFFPSEARLWEALAGLHGQQGREAAVRAALREGLGHLRGRRHRRGAARLLRRLYALEPTDLDVALQLATVLRQLGRRQKAGALLEQLASGSRCGDERRIRAQQFRLHPTPASAWRWLRA